jgi:MFS transporter, OFA family, oxalate/formate antiporter
VPLSDPLVRATGNWQMVFAIAVGMNVAAAVLGIAVLRPLRAARLRAVPTDAAADRPIA